MEVWQQHSVLVAAVAVVALSSGANVRCLRHAVHVLILILPDAVYRLVQRAHTAQDLRELVDHGAPVLRLAWHCASRSQLPWQCGSGMVAGFSCALLPCDLSSGHEICASVVGTSVLVVDVVVVDVMDIVVTGVGGTGVGDGVGNGVSAGVGA